MAKISIFILAGPGNEEGLGRVAHALVAAKELHDLTRPCGTLPSPVASGSRSEARSIVNREV
jgi:hypothetical protein